MALFTLGIFGKDWGFVLLRPVPGEAAADDVGSPTWVGEDLCRPAAQTEWKHLSLIKNFLLWKQNHSSFPTDIPTRSGLESGNSPGRAGTVSRELPVPSQALPELLGMRGGCSLQAGHSSGSGSATSQISAHFLLLPRAVPSEVCLLSVCVPCRMGSVVSQERFLLLLPLD